MSKTLFYLALELGELRGPQAAVFRIPAFVDHFGLAPYWNTAAAFVLFLFRYQQTGLFENAQVRVTATRLALSKNLQTWSTSSPADPRRCRGSRGAALWRAPEIPCPLIPARRNPRPPLAEGVKDTRWPCGIYPI